MAFIKANRDKPFFINAWLHESHTPHVPTPESMERWKHLDAQKQVYAAVITDGDNAVGKILDALKTAGVADNTIVMFSSDNGPESTAAKAGPQKLDPDANVTGYDTYYSVGETGGLRGRKRSVFLLAKIRNDTFKVTLVRTVNVPILLITCVMGQLHDELTCPCE